jgi:hypothetical protein
MTMEPKLTVATYPAVSELQPTQLARLLSELEALTHRARQIIDPSDGLGRHMEKGTEDNARLQIWRQMLLDDSIKFNF